MRQVYIGTELMVWCSARGQREQGAGPSISTHRWHWGRRCWHKSGPVQEISRMDDRQELVICYSHRARRCSKRGWVSSGLIPARESWVAPGGMSFPCMDGAAGQLCAHPSSCMDTHTRHGRTRGLHPPLWSCQCQLPSPHPWRSVPKKKQRRFSFPLTVPEGD